MTLTAEPTEMTYSTEELWRELWVSLASLLRSYTAAHGLNRSEQATVELGEEHIIVRVAGRWLELNRSHADVNWLREDGAKGTMQLTVDGRLQSPHTGSEEELDMQAEAWARELMQ
jgi:hypothetical protein